MEFRRIFDSVARKWWLILVLAVLGGVMGFLYEYYTKPIYEANTKLYIMNLDKVKTDGRALSSSDLDISQQLVREYFDIIYSRSVTSAVSQEVKEYNLSPDAVLSMLSISSRENSNIFVISARGPDPMMVAAVANATGRVFSTQISQLSNSKNVGILDKALVPKYPVNNKRNQEIYLGILSGLMVAFGIIYIIEYFDTTVRSVEDIEKGLNLSVIGIIPEHNIR